MEEIFEIRSCIEILANDIKVNTADEYMLYRRFCKPIFGAWSTAALPSLMI